MLLIPLIHRCYSPTEQIQISEFMVRWEELLISNDNVTLEEVKLLLKHGARVVIKTQFRDPDGILNCLSNLPADSPVFNHIIESAEEFDPCMIRRTQHITERQRSMIMAKATSPLRSDPCQPSQTDPSCALHKQTCSQTNLIN